MNLDPEPSEPLLIRQEVADRLSPPIRVITRSVQEGLLHHVCIDRTIRIPSSAVAEYLSVNSTEAGHDERRRRPPTTSQRAARLLRPPNTSSARSSARLPTSIAVTREGQPNASVPTRNKSPH